MITDKNPMIDEAASTIYSISQDSIMLEKIRAREETIAHENYMKKHLSEMADAFIMDILWGNYKKHWQNPAIGSKIY